jgi:hypothetical protein
MNRRDFLRLSASPRGRTLELSGRQLYMRYLDTQVSTPGEARLAVEGYESWMGEPPALFTRRTAQELMQGLEDDLCDVRTLRILEREWLANTPLWATVEPALAAFRARGGQIEYAPAPDPGGQF